MRWGIAFLAWVLTGLYLANACVDYVRLWQNPLPEYPRERIVPHLKTCAVDQSIDYAWVTAGILGLYYASGRVQRGKRQRKDDAEGTAPRDD